MTAECMRLTLPADAFAVWFARYLPRLADGEPPALFAPAIVSDRSFDGQDRSPRRPSASAAPGAGHLAEGSPAAPAPAGSRRPPRPISPAALPHLADDYMGEHWLASFALRALDE